LLDKKSRVLENLDFIKRSYVKLALFKEREREAQEESRYDALYELSENERILIEDINDCLKFIVPDLISMRHDGKVRAVIAEIDELHGAVISQTLRVRNDLRKSISETEHKLQNIKVFPQSTSSPASHVLDIRA
jgi:hypothetical protein